jgi:hypothetical protein
MRHVASGIALAALIALAGCNNWPHLRNSRGTTGPAVTSRTPTAQELVAYLNANAQRIQGLECREMDLDCSQGIQSVHMGGRMVCQKPRNFRLHGLVGGTTQADIGSNDQEFWFWIAKGDPYLFHCSHQDFSRGNVRLPFPFQPEWVMEALGAAPFDEKANYQVTSSRGNTIELVQQAVSPQGQPVKKVTLFNNGQVSGHLLQDAKGNLLCAAYITEVQPGRATGATLPRRVELVWPAEKLKLKMRLDGVTVNPQIGADRMAVLFTRPNLQNVQTYDLARGPDAPASGLRPAGGIMR